MNKVLSKVIELRKGHYCHALEVIDAYELQNVVEQIINEFNDEFTKDDYIDFFESMELYHLEDGELTEQENERNQDEVYGFDFSEYINEIM